MLAATQDDRRNRQMQLINHPGNQILANRGDPAADFDVAIAGGSLRLLEGGIDPLGYKVEGRPPFISIGARLWWVSTNTGVW